MQWPGVLVFSAVDPANGLVFAQSGKQKAYANLVGCNGRPAEPWESIEGSAESSENGASWSSIKEDVQRRSLG